MRIEHLTGEEIRRRETELRNLWRDCFVDTESYMDFYFKEKPSDSIVLALSEADGICSMLWLNPYNVRINENNFTGYYIVGVATKKEYRGRGYMKALLLESFAYLYEKENPFTYLMPAAEAIYSPYDFRFVYEKESVLKIPSVDAEVNSDTKLFLWKDMSAQMKTAAVNMVNDQLKKEFDVYITRDLSYYQRLEKEMQACDGDIAVLVSESQIKGVISYMHEADRVEVSEAILTTGTELSVFYAYLASKYENAKLSVNYMESHFINCDEKTERKPIIMARIVNMKKFLECLLVQKGCHVTIGVKDPWISDNCRKYLIYEKNGKTAVEVSEEEADITMEIADWTKYFFGKMTTINKLGKINKVLRIYVNDIV